MPSLIQIVSGVTFSVMPKSSMKFSPTVIDRARALFDALTSYPGVKASHVDAKPERMFVAFEVTDTIDFKDFSQRVRATLKATVEHGPDADLLAEVIQRYPELANNPEAGNVVEAFDNFVRVLNRVVKKPPIAGQMPPGAFSASEGTTEPVDAGTHRRLSLRGVAPSQPKKTPATTQGTEPVLPRVYNSEGGQNASEERQAASPAVRGGEAVDEGAQRGVGEDNAAVQSPEADQPAASVGDADHSGVS